MEDHDAGKDALSEIPSFRSPLPVINAPKQEEHSLDLAMTALTGNPGIGEVTRSVLAGPVSKTDAADAKKEFGALIRNHSRANGKDDVKYSEIIYISAGSIEEAHLELDRYANAKGFSIEPLHTGTPVFVATKILSARTIELNRLATLLARGPEDTGA
jgi:hypothetical protein